MRSVCPEKFHSSRLESAEVNESRERISGVLRFLNLHNFFFILNFSTRRRSSPKVINFFSSCASRFHRLTFLSLWSLGNITLTVVQTDAREREKSALTLDRSSSIFILERGNEVL